MLPYGVAIPATVPQVSEIPEGLMNNPVYPPICKSACIYVCMYVYMYIYIYIYMCVCVCVSVCVYHPPNTVLNFSADLSKYNKNLRMFLALYYGATAVDRF